MVATVRQRLHAMNAEKLAEIQRPKNSAQNWLEELHLQFLDVDDTKFYAELPSEISVEMFIGDADDIPSLNWLRMLARSMGIDPDD
jgi:hypothetical protein